MIRYLCAVWLAVAALSGSLPALAIEGHRVWHEGRELTVVDQDGWAIYAGDIILGRTAEVLERSRQLGPEGWKPSSFAKSVTRGLADGRWPRGASGLFEMPIVIESDPDGNVQAAILAFNEQLAGFMRAVPRTNEPDYVAFTLSATDGSGACSSSVGRVGGRQIIQGSHFCGTGTLVHEMGHALGLWHEQEHADRNAYIQFNLNNLDPARASNFATSASQRSATPYDFGSIMHYSATSFARQGQPVMETIPPGIAIGARNAYSAADVEGIKRLYGAAPQAVTVTSFPAGLTVIVDGASVTTPATFNWALGSSHVIDVPANVQVANGVAHVFGRWNVDRGGDLAPRRTVTVAPGDGSINAPATAPAISTYTANFVRYKEVRVTAIGNKAGVGGTATASPAPSTLPGVSGTFYRERQEFSITPTANAGSVFGSWGGSYSFFVANTTSHRVPFRGPVSISDTGNTSFEYRASFFDFPMLTVQARAQDGEVLGVRATVTPSGGTAVDQRLPYNATAWTSGQSGTLTMATTPLSPFATTMRYTFRDWDADPTPTVTVASPAAGQGNRVVTANFNKEYQAFTQVIPSCAGSISLPAGPNGWYAHGSAMQVSLTPTAGWTFVGWEGSLSGTATSQSLAVNDFPNLVARFNTTSAPLAISGVSPGVLSAATGGQIAIDGTGFTAASEVFVNGVRQASQLVGGTRLTATVAGSDLPANGGFAIVTVTNRAAANTCSVSANGNLEVIPTTGAITPQTGWWWNEGESGRGFFIEKNGNNLFMSGYLYDPSGRATWFTAAGPVNGSSFTADINMLRGGQSLTGTYQAPVLTASPGRLTLDFTASDRASLTWPGGTVQLSRFRFGGGAPLGGESGWWWNEAESGRGFSVETQGNGMFMAGFMYDAVGEPIWYVAQGVLNAAGNSFNGTWQQFAGGQTLTGAYRAPSLANGNVGAVTLAYTGPRTANLTLPNGRVVALTRFAF
jgi:hypothetical protein